MDSRKLANLLQSRVALIAATLLLAILQVCSGAPQLDFFRDLEEPGYINRIRLGCIDIRDGTLIPSAIFYLDDMVFFDLNNPQKRVVHRPVLTVATSSNEIYFIINPQAEGDYSCGATVQDNDDIIRSQARTLVGKPHLVVHALEPIGCSHRL